MRKYQQKQLLDLIQLLFEANDEIKRLIAQGNPSTAIQLLTDSQACIVQMGNLIEEIVGVETRTVALLEEFHEELYAASLELEGKHLTNAFVKRLRRKITYIENEIRNELRPNKLEVLFLPYKASMWDSLESVWLAAKVDSSCDAYVVPIPYYDKPMSGGLGEMHYEGQQYPSYVPVVDWHEYDVAARHPDVIFIHNPYDDGNLITSVHPDYYSSQIRAFTDLLAYIPYAISNQSIHSIDCLGPVYADKVFVSDITTCRQFQNQWSELTNGLGKNLVEKPEDKFIALGSPKFDAIVNGSMADMDIPDEWKRRRYNAENGKRPVVLYNTSLKEILRDSPAFTKKLRFVLNAFKENQQYLLLWRPHPLSESTFRTMRKEQFEEYQKIIEDYKRGDYGIFDVSADLKRAVLFSDVYFGTRSSVISLFSCIGKPVIMQSMQVLHKETDCGEAAKTLIAWGNGISRVQYISKLKIGEKKKPIQITVMDILNVLYANDLFLEALRKRQMELFQSTYANADGTAGKQIWVHCKSQLNGEVEEEEE